jgi:glucose-6-phosphate 1-dehydrogenase
VAELIAENPLREGLDDVRTPDPCTIVIFGVTGDLAARKLGPALYTLASENMLPQPYTVVGVGRREWSDEKLRAEMHENIK